MSRYLTSADFVERDKDECLDEPYEAEVHTLEWKPQTRKQGQKSLREERSQGVSDELFE